MKNKWRNEWNETVLLWLQTSDRYREEREEKKRRREEKEEKTLSYSSLRCGSQVKLSTLLS